MLEGDMLRDPVTRKKWEQCRWAGQGKFPLSLSPPAPAAVRAPCEARVRLQASQWGRSEQ